MTTGIINDWHNPHDETCPQNGEQIENDCSCKERAKRTRSGDLINRSLVKKRLLEEINSRQKVRIFTQVSKRTLDAFSALVKEEILRIANDPPRKGKTA